MSQTANPKIRFGLTSKLFLLVMVVYGFLIFLISMQVQLEAKKSAATTIERSLGESKRILDTRLESRFKSIEETCANLARDGLLRPFVYAGDAATLQDQCGELGKSLDFSILFFTNAAGEILAKSDDPQAAGAFVGDSPLFARALAGQPSRGVMRKGTELLQVVALPVFDNAAPDIVRGTVALAYTLSTDLMAEIRNLSGSHIAFYAFVPAGEDGKAVLPHEIYNTFTDNTDKLKTYFAENVELWQRLQKDNLPAEAVIDLAGESYDVVMRPLQRSGGGAVGFVIALRSRTELLGPFLNIEHRVIQVGLICLVIASLLSLVIAKRITSPIIELVAVARGIQNGNYPETSTTTRADEVGVLINAIHRMGRELKDKAELENYLAGLSEDMDADLATSIATQAAIDLADINAETDISEKNQQRLAAVQDRLAIGDLVNNRYRLDLTLGAGAMGVVFRAYDVQLNEPVALKAINNPQMTGPVFEQLKQEIRLARKITHRNVLRTHDFGTYRDLHYITMEYVQGYDLSTLVRKLGPLEIKVGLLLARQICSAVAAAHAEGIIHRDIKPQNVMINRHGVLKIMDFGIAVQSGPVAKGSDTTTPEGFDTRAVIGTPNFMSPEQFSAEAIDERSDIYSLGILLYFMFTARLPYQGGSVWELAAKHLAEPIPQLRDARPDAPPELERILDRAMAKDRDERFPTAQALSAELAAVQA